jgi:hypothetical protein
VLRLRRPLARFGAEALRVRAADFWRVGSGVQGLEPGRAIPFRPVLRLRRPLALARFRRAGLHHRVQPSALAPWAARAGRLGWLSEPDGQCLGGIGEISTGQEQFGYSPARLKIKGGGRAGTGRDDCVMVALKHGAQSERTRALRGDLPGACSKQASGSCPCLRCIARRRRVVAGSPMCRYRPLRSSRGLIEQRSNRGQHTLPELLRWS